MIYREILIDIVNSAKRDRNCATQFVLSSPCNSLAVGVATLFPNEIDS